MPTIEDFEDFEDLITKYLQCFGVQVFERVRNGRTITYQPLFDDETQILNKLLEQQKCVDEIINQYKNHVCYKFLESNLSFKSYRAKEKLQLKKKNIPEPICLTSDETIEKIKSNINAYVAKNYPSKMTAREAYLQTSLISTQLSRYEAFLFSAVSKAIIYALKQEKIFKEAKSNLNYMKKNHKKLKSIADNLNYFYKKNINFYGLSHYRNDVLYVEEEELKNMQEIVNNMKYGDNFIIREFLLYFLFKTSHSTLLKYHKLKLNNALCDLANIIAPEKFISPDTIDRWVKGYKQQMEATRKNLKSS